jgi:fused signal recognition particle receptor
MAQDIASRLEPVAKPLIIPTSPRPYVIVMVGVNGSGKTTTIGKLAARWREDGLKVRIAAADTFRAAAVEQLAVWAQRAGVPLFQAPEGTDPASVAYDALQLAHHEQDDVLLIDTAGRLHNKKTLMDELGKILRVLKKIDPQAPHASILVLDANTGQNAHAQVTLFQETAPLSGLIVTKLDGTSKAGVVVSLAATQALPILAIGVGESLDDLDTFDPQAFAQGLVGLEDDPL